MTSPAPATPQSFWNVPNCLSLSRLVLAAVAFALIVHGAYLAAAAVFVVASITDWLDGYLARLLNQQSAIGRQFDPLVDKVVVCGTLVYLLDVEGSGVWPLMIVTILSRELIVQALRSLIEGQGQPFGARMAGKLKTTAQFLAILAVLVSLTYPSMSGYKLIRDILLWASVVLTVYSGLGYIRLAWPTLRGEASSSVS